MKKVGNPKCFLCARPATCYGHYDDLESDQYCCDMCCGHGNEDGRCRQLDPDVKARLERPQPAPLKVNVPLPKVPCKVCGVDGKYWIQETNSVYCHEHLP